jgi:probable rRNA maturation factor
MSPEDQRGGSRSKLSVVVGNERGRAAVAPGLSRWLARVAPRRTRGLVSLAIVSDRRVRELNLRYRGRDYATDVLSFPSDEVKPGRARTLRPFLGEIVIARGVARRQARAAGHSERTELRVLALHGLLHLIGYDHETDRGEMRRIERRLRGKGGLPVGVIERASPPRSGRR